MGESRETPPVKSKVRLNSEESPEQNPSERNRRDLECHLSNLHREQSAVSWRDAGGHSAAGIVRAHSREGRWVACLIPLCNTTMEHSNTVTHSVTLQAAVSWCGARGHSAAGIVRVHSREGCGVVYLLSVTYRLSSKWRRVSPPSVHAMLDIHNCDLIENYQVP